MKIKRTELLEALSGVQPGLASKEIVEQTQSFIFKDGKVRTYNDQISISCPMDLDIEGGVKAEELFKLLSKSKAKEIELETSDNELLLKTKSSKAGIRLEETVLDMDVIEIPEKFYSLPEDFIEAIRFCLFSVGKDMTKEILTNLHVKENGISSCDNFRVTRCLMKDKVKKAFLLSSGAAQELVKYKPTKYGLAEGWLHFKCEGDILFSCRRMKGKYPDIESLLEVEGEEISLPKNIFSMLERASIFSKTQFKQDDVITIKIEKNKLRIHAKGEGGWFKERAKIKYKGSEISFQTSPHFLMDMSKLLKSMTVGENSLKMEGDGFIHVVSLMAEEEE